MTHTPAPWYKDEQTVFAIYEKANGEKENIFTAQVQGAGKNITKEELCENAAHIVKCVNVHDELLEALERCYEVFDMDAVDTILSMQCGMAIKKARGES